MAEAETRMTITDHLLNAQTLHVVSVELSGRTPDSQSREPGFESPSLPFRRLDIFVLSIDAPVDSAI